MSEHKIGMKALCALKDAGIRHIYRSDVFAADDRKIAQIIEEQTGVKELIYAIECLLSISTLDRRDARAQMAFDTLKKYGAE